MSVEFVILCEDLQTEVFIRNFLINRGVKKRKFTPRICPSGQQAGEQWVRRNFPKELQATRSRSDVSLIVCIDADNRAIDDRKNQLDQACTQAGIEPRKPEEAVLVIVPKRNIETWFAYLRGEDVDEETSYPKYARESECKPQASALHELCHRKQHLPDSAPNSLKEACRKYYKRKV